MKTAGIIVLVIVLLLVFAAAGWVIFARWRAERLGLPPPAFSSFIPFYTPRPSYGIQPAPGGVVGWFNDHFRSFKVRHSRSAMGAYEGTVAADAAGAGRTRSGFGPLDPDDAWDTRVGADADAYYYAEEQELGLHGTAGQRGPLGTGVTHLDLSGNSTAYLGGGAMGGSSYDMNLARDEAVAANKSSDNQRGRARVPASTGNPFDDDEADTGSMNLRGVSPRPMAETDLSGTTPSGARSS